MKEQFLNLTGLTELVGYLKTSIANHKEILPYASNKLFPSVGDINTIYINTATNTIYRWDSSSKTYITLAKAVKSVAISEATENGKITLTVDGNKTTVPIHGLGSAAYTNSSAYSPAGHTHTKAQVGLGNVDNTADANKSVKHATTADSATTAGTATNVSAGEGTADAARHVWFSDSTTETKRAYSDKFKYNPVTNNLTVNVTGNAATASSVAWGNITGKPSTYTPSAHNHNDSTITSLNASKLFGTIDIARLPHGALERLVIVEDDTARFKLTTANIQLGDTVKVTKTEKMYYVVDESKLSSEAGYSVYTAGTATSVPWSGVTEKPSSYPPASHNHDERYYTETEMNSKLAEKATKVHTHTKSEVGLGNVDNTADANKSVKYAASASKATLLAPAYTSGTFSTASSTWRAGVTEGKVVWGQSWIDRSMSGDTADLTIWIKKVTDNVTTANMTIDGTITAGTGFIGSLNGNASSATALTSSAGSATQPVYFSGGKPVACSYTLGKSVPSNAVFTDTNTWRGIQNNLTSDSTSDSLSAAQGKALKALVDSKAASSHTHNYLPLTGGTMSGTAMITWPDSGNWTNSNKNVTFPVIRGGLSWIGQSDGIQLYAVETQNDNLELYLKFTDDNSNGLSIRNKENTQTARISANGEITASKFVGKLTGNADSATKLANARKIGSASFDGTADITLSQMGLNVPVEITKADYLAKKKAGTLNANTYYNVIDEYDSANVINDSSVTANSAFSSTKSEKTYAKKSTLVTTTLTASKWTGSSAPYTYVLPVSGATTSNIVEINYASNASSQAIEAYQNAMLADGGQTTNQITIKATEKPTVDIPITIVIRNDL